MGLCRPAEQYPHDPANEPARTGADAVALDKLPERRVQAKALNLQPCSVLTAFQDCETALAEIDATPAPSTRKLLKQLQR